MKKLIKTQPDLLTYEKTDNSYTLSLLVPHDLDYFKGHFTDGPILAGVVQLDWAVAAICKYYNVQQAVKNVEVLKFQVVITPGIKIELLLQQKAENKYTFSYHSAKGQHASGRIIFDSLINE
ncbi:thioester dehydrase [Pseudoalteromonas sp. SG45-5]|uniref:ApeI family dehydratase n=1 Tax=unclassified Pseudoalteromonas TaxID=194690 RepID=UPI0015FC404C|nr:MULTISPECIES: thioester dehydrase [unclassified Pseudoalteromonas]MBB1384899.1 thioester dehydrase [Pseudoalteromonas sp. SG45-5]MBB1392813.1 thioester dehydrase [Pseudoalteromonas sp. SG44-4]MBB1446023.1 thioester dehydrase [Pseudoalteromonas sp. SG41-6]